MTLRALGLTVDTVDLGPPALRTPYATTTKLSLTFALRLRDFILANPIADQIGSPTFESVNELALSYVGGNYLEGYTSFEREVVKYNPLKASTSGFSIDTNKLLSVVYTDAAESSAASTTIISGGAIEAYILKNRLSLNAGYSLGVWGSGSVSKGASVTITGVDSLTNLPTLGLATAGTAPDYTWYAMHSGTAGEKIGFGSLSLCLSKAAFSSLGGTTTTPGTHYISAAAGTWGLAASVNDAYSMQILQEDSGAVLMGLSVSHTF